MSGRIVRALHRMGADFTGRRNLYTCSTCGGFVVTIDRDHGVTPFSIRCRAKAECTGMMSSAGYPPHVPAEPTYEWYRPKPAEVSKMSHEMQEHCARGGLALREIAA